METFKVIQIGVNTSENNKNFHDMMIKFRESIMDEDDSAILPFMLNAFYAIATNKISAEYMKILLISIGFEPEQIIPISYNHPLTDK
jgi:hypothetical protein